MSFERVWRKIEQHAGETFHTVTDKAFTYVVTGNTVTTNRTNYPIHRGNFEKVWPIDSIAGPGEISNVVRGSSYVWAIMSDPRIRTPAV